MYILYITRTTCNFYTATRLEHMRNHNCNTNQSKRPEYLEFFEQAINGNYNDKTEFTPMELHSGAMLSRVWDEYCNVTKIGSYIV